MGTMKWINPAVSLQPDKKDAIGVLFYTILLNSFRSRLMIRFSSREM